LCLAIAVYKLRDFKKLKTVANLGLALDPSEAGKELLKEYVEKCKEQKEMRIDRNILQQMYESGVDCDFLCISSAAIPFANLNRLYYAVSTGDVTLMEEDVARGAAIDFPVGDENEPDLSPIPAPPGSTALLLACAMLAMNGEMERRYPDLRRDTPTQEAIDRVCVCALRLVHLGANCQVKLQIFTQRGNALVNPNDPVDTWRAFNFGGKTPRTG
jgi:hypothetical protein